MILNRNKLERFAFDKKRQNGQYEKGCKVDNFIVLNQIVYSKETLLNLSYILSVIILLNQL